STGRGGEMAGAYADACTQPAADELERRRLGRQGGKRRRHDAGSLTRELTRERAASRSWSRNHSPANGRNHGCPSYGAGTSGNSRQASTGGSPPPIHRATDVPRDVINATPVPQQPIAGLTP